MEVAHIIRGNGPVVATAIHDGHAVRPELREAYAVSEDDRLREEDPFTGFLTGVAQTRLVGARSRFEFDLNRPRESAVYRRPEDAWGLAVWRSPPAEQTVLRSLEGYDLFDEQAAELLDEIAGTHEFFVVLDLHSYNHRRGGPDAAPDDPRACPDINLGTDYIDREYWAPVIDRFVEGLSRAKVGGRTPDVRENVKFRGGWFPRWVDARYPGRACAIAVEFKKIFMDEWTGMPDEAALNDLLEALRGTIDGLEDGLSALPGQSR